MTEHTVDKRIGRLHVITEGDDGGRPYRSHAELASMAIDGGADTIQYRSKGANFRTLIAEAGEVVWVCRERGVLCLINDRVDLCLAVGADGVHLGGEDMPIGMARRILGAEKVIGATVRDISDLRAAEAESADYIGLGPIFRTESKRLHIEPLGLERVAMVSRAASVPVIGIAGITAANAPEVIRAGAYGIAVIGEVARASDPRAAAAAVRDSVERAVRSIR